MTTAQTAAAENRQVAHTPGPWTVHELEDQGKFSIVHWGPLAYVGDVGGHDGMATARANARLIAAAPELLCLLRRFYAATYGVESTSALCQLDFEQARQAIARATGE
jgi:hypothetical protein